MFCFFLLIDFLDLLLRYHDFKDGMPERLLKPFKFDILSCKILPLHLSYHLRGLIGNRRITKKNTTIFNIL